ncbi:hypothetical protein FOPG_13639 [Fusarium oxysporum f. sp. conglutinans race 2 54008]|uniref:Uncharacterized protein n=1 Tax=Fusarium oxysporum f. sp. conglutinans race 2 54008 TaxID=1089457 RepID=X0H3C2_FUSOX|nr:hypothetical protein FOPG_13639 [Fusarium oxysporum f. sp. conglutinans race 2 54008]KAI8419615.1 hypothetical protein FOFC_02204 [Fusarium oxysporum]
MDSYYSPMRKHNGMQDKRAVYTYGDVSRSLAFFLGDVELCWQNSSFSRNMPFATWTNVRAAASAI